LTTSETSNAGVRMIVIAPCFNYTRIAVRFPRAR